MPTVDQSYDPAVPLDALTPSPVNPNESDVGAISTSIERNGFYGAVLASRDGTIIAGEHRWRAAAAVGEPTVPVLYLNISAATARRILLADNRTAELARRDEAKLADLLRSVVEDAGSVDALIGTGYDGDDLDQLLADLGANSDEEPAEVVSAGGVPTNPRTKPGDLWILGEHRLLCGDCRNPNHVARLLDGATINVAFTSPPYAEQRAYDRESDFRPVPPSAYVEWFRPVAEQVAEHLATDGSWFVNIKPSVSEDGLDTLLYVFDLVTAHVREWGWHFATEFCWERVGVPGHAVQRFKNQFEPVYQFARGKWKMRADQVKVESDAAITPLGPGSGPTSWADPTSNFTTQGDSHGEWFEGRYGPGWAFPGNRLPTFMGSHEALGHTAAFPVGLPEWFVKAYSDPGDTVYDPFVGSGSTLLAAHSQDRCGYGIEISPGYCDVICERFQRHTGLIPVRDGAEVNFTASGILSP